jgi:hypothetical protein
MARIFPPRATRNGPPNRRSGNRRLAAWLGLAGIVLQALFPLLFATAGLAKAHAAAPLPGQSAIHPHHSQHQPAPHAPPAGHPHGHAAHCILCLGLHPTGPMALPGGVALVLPRDNADIVVGGRVAVLQIARLPAPYAPRAPPPIG